jgi:allophanate hydrolase subunit 2
MLTVLQAGLSLIQDGTPRELYSSGIPSSGAFDEKRLRQSNYLVGNSLNNATIEHHTGKFEFTSSKDVLVAVVSSGEVAVRLDGETQALLSTIKVPAYSFISIETTHSTHGLTYIAISGLDPKIFFGSASYDTFSKLGNPPIEKGMTFNLSIKDSDFDLSNRIILEYSLPKKVYEIPYVEGPHYDTLQLYNRDLNLSVDTISRSGVRLSSEQPLFAKSLIDLDLLSLPVFPGVIQITKNGDPIILGPDAGVTGGYPVLGTVPKYAMYLLSRLSIGQSITLKNIKYEDSLNAKTSLNLGLIS